MKNLKKIVLTLIIVLMLALNVNAQIATENSNGLDNISVGTTIGVSTPLDLNSMFPLNTQIGFKVNKDVTPVVGAQFEGIVFLNDNHFGDMHAAFDAINFNANTLLNLTNMFAGYNGRPRVFEMGTVTGLGWLHGNGPVFNNFVANTGIDLTFNIGHKRAHSIVLNPGIMWNLSRPGNFKFSNAHSQAAIKVSYVYHFNNSNGTHYFKTYDVGAMQREIDYLNRALKEKQVVTDKTTPEKQATNIINNTFVINDNSIYVFFAYDSDKLDDRAKEQLDKIGQNGIYYIDAFASNEGSTEYNLALSQRRADAVKVYLESRGCKIDKSVGHGVVFGPTTGRVAIVTAK